MRGTDFLKTVEVLRPYATDEWIVRTQIGRAYYATFWEARSFVETHLGYVRSGRASEHREVATRLAFSDQQAFRALSRLRVIRNAADYDDGMHPGAVGNLWVEAETLSAWVITRLAELTQDAIEAENAAEGSAT